MHNDEKYIQQWLQLLQKTLENNFLHSEIICVNDASTDHSVEMVRDFSRQVKGVSISILNMGYYQGLELSMNAGVNLAIGDFVFEFDGVIPDFTEETIMAVYRRALQGFDIVSASPKKRKENSSRLFYYLFNTFSHRQYIMGTERFRILSRRVINRIDSTNKVVPYRKAIYANCGLPTDLYYYEPSENIAITRDTQEKKYRMRLGMDALLLFTDAGYRFSMLLTGFMMLMTLFMACYAVVTYLISVPVPGWTTTILFLSFAFFGVFGGLTIVIKYLQIITSLTFKRKRYSFESIEKLTNE